MSASCRTNNAQRECCVYPRDEGSRVTAELFLTSAPDGGEQSASRPDHLISGKNPGTNVTAGSAPEPVRPVFRKGISFYPALLEPRTVRPEASRYTGRYIRPSSWKVNSSSSIVSSDEARRRPYGTKQITRCRLFWFTHKVTSEMNERGPY